MRHFMIMGDPAIHIYNVTRSFGNTTILDNVSFDIMAGQVFGLVGLNGSGKTTLIRIIAGLMSPDSGECSVLGENPLNHRERFYRRLGIVLENSGFWGNLTVLQNLRFFARAKGISHSDMVSYFETEWRGTSIFSKNGRIKFFSRGEKVQCSLARAFLGKPEVFLFDEPAVALDIKAYDHFCGMVKTARDRGAAVLISSHQLEAIEELCDRIGILENGRISDFGAKSRGSVRWVAVTGNNPEFGVCISSIAGNVPEYRGGAWHFLLQSDKEDDAGKIVTGLVSLGAVVTGIGREDGDLRESMRRHYGSGH